MLLCFYALHFHALMQNHRAYCHVNLYAQETSFLPFTKRFRKVRLKNKRKSFPVVPVKNFREQRNIWKSGPVFLACKQVLCLGKRWIFSPFFPNRKPVHRLCFSDVKFQTEVRVTFLQTHFWYQFQAAEAVFWICANGNFFYAYINGKQSLSYGLTLSG